VVWAGFLEDLVLVLPATTVHGGLTLLDPGRVEYHGPWDVQGPNILHSSAFTPQREESCLNLGE